MKHRTRSVAIAPRLLMLAAVFFCVFGFAIHGAGESHASAHSHASVTATATQGDHAGHSAPADAVTPDNAAHPLDRHDGHTGDGDHAINCMPSAATSQVATAPALDVATVSVAADLAAPRFAASSAPAALPRPPDLRSLCVQRV